MKLMAPARGVEPPEISVASFELCPGLIGLSDFTQADLTARPEELPFRWMQVRGPGGSVDFVVIEPWSVRDDYAPEIFAADASALGIVDAADAMVLNIVTLAAEHAGGAKINLVGPIVVNRRTRRGRQVILANHARYDAFQPLMAAAVSTTATE